eukprot:scpid96747/ scgid0943/ Poly [ADP-ribose] polymerase 11
MAMNSLWKTKSVPKQVDYPLPREWESQTKDVELKQVKPSSHEYQQAERLLHKTLPKVRLLNILRIQNKYLWRRYNQTRENIHRKLGKHVEEKLLFHGSGGVEPEKVQCVHSRGDPQSAEQPHAVSCLKYWTTSHTSCT